MTVRRGLWLGLWSLILPALLYFVLALFVGLDTLDLSSTTGNTILVVAAGVLAGLVVAIGLGLRDWRILIPPLTTGLMGLGHYPLLETAAWADENQTLAYVLVWLAQSFAMFASTSLSLRMRAAGLSEAGNDQKPAERHPGSLP